MGSFPRNTSKSLVEKRSITINGKKTSVSLEPQFWDTLHDCAAAEHLPLGEMIRVIRGSTNCSNLSSAIRVYVFEWIQKRAVAY